MVAVLSSSFTQALGARHTNVEPSAQSPAQTQAKPRHASIARRSRPGSSQGQRAARDASRRHPMHGTAKWAGRVGIHTHTVG